MLDSVISSCVLCFLLFLCYEQVVCLPLKDNKNTTKLLISRQNLPNETSKKLVILSRRKKLTYEDLPDDGSMDEEFEKLQAQQSKGEDSVELDNAVYFQGDIKLDPLTKLYMEVDRNLPPRRKRAVASNRNMRWDNRTVPYAIDRSLPGKTKFVIRQAIRHWKSNTCLRFRRKRVSDVDYINFYDDGEACWSRVGKIGGKQNISIAKHCATRGVVVHEIGHAVGFYHEQARRDRDQYIEIIKKNIERRDIEQFRRMSHTLVDSMGFAYDYWSIMHYGRTAFSKNKKDTIRIKKIGRRVKAEIGRRVLSRLDIAQIREMYSCNPLPSYEARKGCFRSRHRDGREYRGTLDYTEKGTTCQHWSDNYPHNHKKKLHKHGLGNHNYCRNPGGRRLKPWCFTTKTNERWEYCDVRICSN